ncbi:hypothetical protein BD777DRAFT_165815 [Yarrowia lipolytica]|nr:hypothetical protein BD777DRAFT_165815 [Yarrowia lipolytica]
MKVLLVLYSEVLEGRLSQEDAGLSSDFKNISSLDYTTILITDLTASITSSSTSAEVLESRIMGKKTREQVENLSIELAQLPKTRKAPQQNRESIFCWKSLDGMTRQNLSDRLTRLEKEKNNLGTWKTYKDSMPFQETDCGFLLLKGIRIHPEGPFGIVVAKRAMVEIVRGMMEIFRAMMKIFRTMMEIVRAMESPVVLVDDDFPDMEDRQIMICSEGN